MEPTITDLMGEIKQLRIDVDIIKDNIVNGDGVLTAEEGVRFDQAMDEYRKGETVALEEIEVARKNAGFEIQ